VEIDGHTVELLAVLVVAGQPVGKQRHRDGRNGRKYTPARTREYEQRIAWTAASHRNLREDPIVDAGDMLMIRARAIFHRVNEFQAARHPDGLILKKTKPDTDNVLKSILDGLSKSGVLPDDARFVGCTGWKYWTERDGKPRTEIEIYRVLS